MLRTIALLALSSCACFLALLPVAAKRAVSPRNQIAAHLTELATWAHENGLDAQARGLLDEALDMQPSASAAKALVGKLSANSSGDEEARRRFAKERRKTGRAVARLYLRIISAKNTPIAQPRLDDYLVRAYGHDAASVRGKLDAALRSAAREDGLERQHRILLAIQRLDTLDARSALRYVKLVFGTRAEAEVGTPFDDVLLAAYERWPDDFDPIVLATVKRREAAGQFEEAAALLGAAQKLAPSDERAERVAAIKKRIVPRGTVLRTARKHPMKYYLQLPKGWTPKKRWPVLVVADWSAHNWKGACAGFSAALEKRGLGFIVVSLLIAESGRDPAVIKSIRSLPRARRRELAEQGLGGMLSYNEPGMRAVMDDVREDWSGEERFYITGYNLGNDTVWRTIFARPEWLAGAAPSEPSYAPYGAGPVSVDEARESLPVRIILGTRHDLYPRQIVKMAETLRRLEESGFEQVTVEMIPGASRRPFTENVADFLLTLRGRKEPPLKLRLDLADRLGDLASRCVEQGLPRRGRRHALDALELVRDHQQAGHALVAIDAGLVPLKSDDATYLERLTEQAPAVARAYASLAAHELERGATRQHDRWLVSALGYDAPNVRERFDTVWAEVLERKDTARIHWFVFGLREGGALGDKWIGYLLEALARLDNRRMGRLDDLLMAALTSDADRMAATFDLQWQAALAAGQVDAVHRLLEHASRVAPTKVRTEAMQKIECDVAKKRPLLKTAASHDLKYYVQLPTKWSTRRRDWPVVVASAGLDSDYLPLAKRAAKIRGDRGYILIVPLTLTSPLRQLGKPHSVYSREIRKRHALKPPYEGCYRGRCEFDVTGILAAVDDVAEQFGGRRRFFFTSYMSGYAIVWMALAHPDRLVAAAGDDVMYIVQNWTWVPRFEGPELSTLALRYFVGKAWYEQVRGGNKMGKYIDQRWSRIEAECIERGLTDVAKVHVQGVPGKASCLAHILDWYANEFLDE